MTEGDGAIRRLNASGTPRAIGRVLGHAGRRAVHAHLLRSRLWQEVTGPRFAPVVARLGDATRAKFPQVWEEIEGLAEGLDLPIAEVFAWNCRGDLLASVPDGCTTVLVPGDVPVIAHNEDGLPFFRGTCFLAEVAQAPDRGFLAFCYPGSIPGHTFAATRTGLVQAVNNIRLTRVDPEIPRMVLGRAVLDTHTLDDALVLLRQCARSGGFHFALSHWDARRLVSVEFGGGSTVVSEVRAPMVHANHALYPTAGDIPQIVTRSSADRQGRGTSLLEEGADPLTILRDTGGPGLPIRRDDPEDPDEENTMATAVMTVSEDRIGWQVFTRTADAPEHFGWLCRSRPA